MRVESRIITINEILEEFQHDIQAKDNLLQYLQKEKEDLIQQNLEIQKTLDFYKRTAISLGYKGETNADKTQE